MMREISVNEIEAIRIGQTENEAGGTGCTVLICPEGMAAGLDVRGGGPASRESELLKPLTTAQCIHALVLAGGSAFGLDAAGGVMRFLEERGIGYDVGITKVPLVCQADLFDLTVGDPYCRPDFAMGYAAAKQALEAPNYRDGNYGAGCGATVGKFGGMETCMKSGIGSYGIDLGELRIAAVIAVNSYGDVFDHRTGKRLAGLLTPDKRGFADTKLQMCCSIARVDNKFTGNTVIGAILTNAVFTKTQLCKIASMGHNGLARSICPVHTSADGDSLFALSAGTVDADPDLVGMLAADVVAEAVKRAVLSAESAYGFPAAGDIVPEPA